MQPVKNSFLLIEDHNTKFDAEYRFPCVPACVPKVAYRIVRGLFAEMNCRETQCTDTDCSQS